MMKICSISAASPINFSSPFIHLNPAGFEVSFHPAKTLVLKNSSIFLINSIISASSVNEVHSFRLFHNAEATADSNPSGAFAPILMDYASEF